MPHLIWTADAEGVVQFVNRRWISYTGVPRDQLGRDAPLGVIHPDDIQHTWDLWQAAVKAREPFELEYRLRRAEDGAFRWFLARAVPVLDSAGAVRMWIGTSTDIDAQKRANENLTFVLDASGIFAQASSIESIASEFCRLAVQRFADWAIMILADEKNVHQIRALEHRDPEKAREVWKFVERYPVAGDPWFMAMLERGEPVLVQKITEEMMRQSARDGEHLQIMKDLQLYSAIVAPLVSEGRKLGAVVVYSAESRRAFDESDLEVMRMLSERAAAAIDRVRALRDERMARRRLQLIGRAAELIYESLDLTATFGELANMIVSLFADMAIVVRVENESAVRIIAGAHRDPGKDDLARSFVGVRPFQPDAERRMIEALASHKPLVQDDIRPDLISKTTWPYLASEIGDLSPSASVTIPLHSRGRTSGAIIVYNTSATGRFSPEEVDVLREIGRHASVAMENADVFERERRISETLQDSLLPPSLPHMPGARFDAVYLPSYSSAQVGGDWYDAFALSDGTLIVSAGDVTGRGPDAAVIMGKSRHLLAIAPSYDRDPARILDTVETVLARRYPDKIVTAFLGIIDPDRKTMTYANAGHPPPLLRRENSIEELSADGLPLGLRRHAEPAQARTVDLSGARMLVVFTDGLVESTHDVLGGYRRLYDVVSSQAVLHTHNPARFIEESCLHGNSDDDVAVLTLSLDTTMRWTFDAENAKAAQDARDQFVRYLRRLAGNSENIAMAEIIFGELVGNVVRHSPGAIDIDVDWSKAYPVLHVIDRGKPFDLRSVLPADILAESGRGLFIVKQLARTLEVEHVQGYGNHVMAELPLRRELE